MKTTLTALLAASAIGMVALPANAQNASAHAGHSMSQSAPATVVDVAVGSPDHTTLVQAVTAADLAGTLQGTGPFTVFAPSNAAFEKVPAEALQGLLSPAGKADLTKVLTYHVVPGKVLAADLIGQIEAGGGQATLTTVEGSTLTARQSGSNVVITDETGGQATVTATDLEAGNGVVHVTDTVFMAN